MFLQINEEDVSVKLRTVIVSLAVLAAPTTGFAQQGMSKEEWIKHEAEREFKESTMSRLKALEDKYKDPKTGKEKDAWWDAVRFYGDFRFRHETIDTSTSLVRHRSRIRARINMESKVNDEVKLGFRLATNESNDPVSTNQTLTSGFSKKAIELDAAYVAWMPMNGLTVEAGKTNQPFYQPGKSDLIWDQDLTPEGLVMKYSRPLEGIEFFMNAAGYWVNEKSGALDDTAMYGAQAGVKADLGGDMKLTAGGSIFAYPDSKNEATFFSQSNAFGNQTNGASGSFTYAKKFVEVEAFVELATMLMEKPLTLFWDYVDNIGTSHDDIAWLAGFSYGKLTNPGDMALTYNYRKLTRNSVIGAFTDSDAGGGGTNHKGHKLSTEIQIAKKWTGALTYFRSETALAANTQTDYNRFQFDFVFKF